MNRSLRLLPAIVSVAIAAAAQANVTADSSQPLIVAATEVNYSVVRVPIEIPYATMEALANEKSPRVVSGVKDNPTSAMYDDTLRYTINRGDIHIGNGGSCLAITMPISGSATAHGRVGARGWLGRRIASFTLSETANFSGTVSGCLSFDINPDWTLQPSVNLNLALDRAEVRLIRNWIPVSFRGLATDEFNAHKDAIVRDVASQIVSSLKVQQRVQQAWSAMHAVYPINANPAVFARVEPQRIVFQPLDFSRAGVVNVGIGLVAKIQTTVGAKPIVPRVAALPAPESIASLPALSNLRVPVVIHLAAVNEALAKKFDEGPVSADEHGRLAITSARLVSSDGRAKLQIQYEVQRPWYLPDLSGEFSVQAQLDYNAATQTLAFKNLDYTLQSRTELMNAAAYLLKPIVLQSIERRAKVELAPHLANLRSSANKQAVALLPRDSGGVIRLDKVRIDSVTLRDGVLIATVAGDVATEVKLADAGIAMRR